MSAPASRWRTTCAALLLPGLWWLVGPAAMAGDADGALPGRLFTTAAERRALDAGRDPPGVGHDTQAPLLHVDGLVQRRDGRGVIWVNGARAGAHRAVLTAPDHRGVPAVQLGDGTNRIQLRPGQAWQQAAGRIVECFGCREPAPADDGGAAGNTGVDEAP